MKREEQIEKVLKVFEVARKNLRPHILVGDFNSNSPRQIIDPMRCKEKTRKEWEENGGMVPRHSDSANVGCGICGFTSIQ